MLKNKKCLVTGSNGFIGRHLVDRLHKEEAIVYSLNRTSSRVKTYQQYIVDIRDSLAIHKVIQEIKPEYIFHFAGSTLRESPEQTHLIDINAFGTKNVLNALSSIKYNLLIYPSTSSVYNNNYSIFSEDTEREPKTIYGTSKLLAEESCLEHIKFGKTIIIVRPSSIYGPGQERTLEEVVDLLSVLCKDKKGKIVSVPFRESTDYLHQRVDLTKVEALLGWKAKVSLEEGLEKTIKLWRRNSF